MTARAERRSYWTWGYESDEPSDAQRKEAAGRLSQRFGREVEVPKIAVLDDVELTPSRIAVPGKLGEWVRTDHVDRATHTYGGHSMELLRAGRGVFTNPPGESAGRLVEAAGLKGHAIGGARISPVHANFIEAGPEARAGDVIALMDEARRRVRAAGGPVLYAEVRYLHPQWGIGPPPLAEVD